MIRVIVDWAGIRDRIETFLAAERANWPGWLAVALGIGIAVYFALPVEPVRWVGPASTAALIAALVVLRRHRLALVVLAALASVAVGFSAAQIRTVLIAAPQLQQAIRFAHVEGRIMLIEPYPTGIRVTLDRVWIRELPRDETPARIQVRVYKGAATLAAGDEINLLARLQPPAPPSAPGAFDFRRQAFFAELGATGFAFGTPRILQQPSHDDLADSFWLWIDRLRATIGRRIAEEAPDASGAMTRALTVGDQTALTMPDTNAMRMSGLAHLLSISGLHIGMAAGLFFIGFRFLLALFPALALRYPIKKWSAAAAIGAAGFYSLLAGASVPTERSFFMIAIVFIGVMLDRWPFSLRMLSWAAIVILLIQPESITGASFQMSFFAVLGLIAAFEVLNPRLRRWRARTALRTDWFGRVTHVLHHVAFWLGSTTLTSVVATLLTGAFAMYHFDRISTYGVVANLIAIPLTGFWVMPMEMLALLAMPFGLDAPFWHGAAWGCDGILWIARTVGGWPYSVAVTPAMPLGSLVAIACGVIMLCMLRTRARLLGALPILAGLLAIPFTTAPDLLISGDAKLVAVKDDTGRYWLSSSRAGRLAAETWLRRNAQADASLMRDPKAPVKTIACDDSGCTYHRNGRSVDITLAGDAPAESCAPADLLVNTVPIRDVCARSATSIDRGDLWRNGAYAVWIKPDGQVILQSVAQTLGDRPWVLDRMRESIRSGGFVQPPSDDGIDEEAVDTAEATMD